MTLPVGKPRKMASFKRLEIEQRIVMAVYEYSEIWQPINVGICLEHLETKRGIKALLDIDAFIMWCQGNYPKDIAVHAIMQNVPHDLNCCDDALFSPRTLGYAKILQDLIDEKYSGENAVWCAKHINKCMQKSKDYNERTAYICIHEFKVYDADGELFYTGFSSCDSSFAPLDDYGRDTFGATEIRYKDVDGQFTVL